MAVGLSPPRDIKPVRGISLASVAAGIRKPGRLDLTLIQLSPGAQVVGAFTRNAYCAAPVLLCRDHLEKASPLAFVINTGCANAGTGQQGLAAATSVCQETSRLLKCRPEEVLPFSTGVIMEPLPTAPILCALPICQQLLSSDGWLAAAQAIMTTDTVPKAVSRQMIHQGQTYTCTGIAKGAGMIHPNMATMLSFIGTDAPIAPTAIKVLWHRVVDRSFHCVSVDGDTSTNDSAMLIATGQSGEHKFTPSTSGWDKLEAMITDVAIELAQAIARDGEGATKFVTLQINSGRNEEECRQVGLAMARSPLVKTAFFASDPNLGRLLAAIGNSGIIDFTPNLIRLWLGDTLVVEGGERHPHYQEQEAAAWMKKEEFSIRVDLGRGAAQATLWTCDFSHDYVRINAEYRS